MNMKRILSLALAALLGFALGSIRSSAVSANSAHSNGDSASFTSAAYRDGLYLGQLDAASGRQAHVSLGRWSSDQNRALFRAGYESGYRQAGTSFQ